MVNNLFKEQVRRFPEYIIIYKSIETGRNIWENDIIPKCETTEDTYIQILEYIRKNIREKGYVQLAEFIIEGKQGDLRDYDYVILTKIKNDEVLSERANFVKTIDLGVKMKVYEWIDSFASLNNMYRHKFGYYYNAITSKQFRSLEKRSIYWASRQKWVYKVYPNILNEDNTWKEINERMIILPSEIIDSDTNYGNKYHPNIPNYAK